MTINELYKFCKERNLLDAKIKVCQISVNGCFIGYKYLKEKDISYALGDDEYGEKEKSIILER